jgi:hypothetical protein
VTTGERFRAAWQRRDGAVELLPDDLAGAVAEVLDVAGAGLSVVTSDGFRVPLGASDAVARTAERLQFTHGEGPCLAVAAAPRIVRAAAADFAQRWPALYTDLRARTSYRSVVAVPVPFGVHAAGAYDLYLTDPDAAAALSDADLQAVSAEIVRAVAAVVLASGTPPDVAWLGRPAARRRTGVWIAIGLLNATLGLPASDALARLRSFAYARELSVDDVAGALVARELEPAELAV